jgi:hypothetical protein
MYFTTGQIVELIFLGFLFLVAGFLGYQLFYVDHKNDTHDDDNDINRQYDK